MPCKVLAQTPEVETRLDEWSLPRDILLDIFDRAIGERANVTSSDPVNTGGNEMRRWMTRFLRDDGLLKSLGWVSCDADQLEGIRNDQLKIKLVQLNTDARTAVPSKMPNSISERGPAAYKRIMANEDRRQGNLFFINGRDIADPFFDYDFLYFCTHVSGEMVSAEVSRPSELRSGFVTSFSERVILTQPGERPGLRRGNVVIEEFAVVEKPQITRKK